MPRGGQATLGFRPEDIALVRAGRARAPSRRGSPSPNSPAPSASISSPWAAAPVIVRTPASTVLHPGETVALGLDPARLHLFDGTGDDAAALR